MVPLSFNSLAISRALLGISAPINFHNFSASLSFFGYSSGFINILLYT
jgi:hypothetical protein